MSIPRLKPFPGTEPVRVDPAFSSEFPDGEASATEVVLNLTLAGVAALNRTEDVLAEFGLVITGFNVLAVLAGAREPLTPTAVAERTFIAKATVTSVLDRLERRELVRRAPNPDSRRSLLVAVTADGNAMCTAILDRLHASEARWLAGMPERDRQSLVRLLGVARGLLSTATTQ